MIERLKEEQIDAVMEIWLSANIQAHDFINKSYWLSNYQKVKEEFLPVSETYVFVQEGQVRGFISILNGDYIGGLFVAPFCQRQGIGSFPKLKIPHQSHADFCSTDTAGGLDNKKRRYAPRGGVAYRLFLWGFPKGATPPFGTRLCEAKCSVLYALPALP